MNASGGGGAAFICYWLVVFVCFFLLWESFGEKKTNSFSGGDRSFVLWVSLAIILSSFALFLHIRLLPPPPPPAISSQC